VLAYARAEQPASGHWTLNHVCFSFSPFLPLNKAKKNTSRMQEMFDLQFSGATRAQGHPEVDPFFLLQAEKPPQENLFDCRGHRCWLWISLWADSAASPVSEGTRTISKGTRTVSEGTRTSSPRLEEHESSVSSPCPSTCCGSRAQQHQRSAARARLRAPLIWSRCQGGSAI